MAKPYGYNFQMNEVSEQGEPFNVGQVVAFKTEFKSRSGVIEKLLVNSAIIKLTKMPEDVRESVLVVSYRKLTSI